MTTTTTLATIPQLTPRADDPGIGERAQVLFHFIVDNPEAWARQIAPEHKRLMEYLYSPADDGKMIGSALTIRLGNYLNLTFTPQTDHAASRSLTDPRPGSRYNRKHPTDAMAYAFILAVLATADKTQSPPNGWEYAHRCRTPYTVFVDRVRTLVDTLNTRPATINRPMAQGPLKGLILNMGHDGTASLSMGSRTIALKYDKTKPEAQAAKPQPINAQAAS